MILMVPKDLVPYPTLGPQVCDFMEQNMVFGPGDLRGKPLVLDDERRALVYRIYEVYPKRHVMAGRRRFKRVGLSLPKGLGKTEFAALIAACELHPEAPVRCTGFTKKGEPIGGPVTDPYIPMVAYTEEQTEELAYGALLFICQEGPDADLFDAGKEQITRIYGDGKAEAMASSPNSVDGARTTCQHFDETHRMVLQRLKDARQTMRNNLPKRVIADAWELETTTTYAEGEGSCAQDTHEYAESIAQGKIKDSTLFFFHREAPARDDEDLDDPAQIRAAIRTASGPALAQWFDFEGQVDSIASLYAQPDTDKAYWERVWLNRRVSRSRQAFDPARWKTLARPDVVIAEKEPIAVGFDGARWRDAAGFIATHIETGFQWPLSFWERPEDARPGEWEVTDDQVDGALAEHMDRYNIVLLFADPPRFEANVAKWSGTYGTHRVVEWYTNRPRQIGQAMRAYATAQTSGALTHNGDPTFARHIGNGRKANVKQFDDDGTPLWTIYKPKPDSSLYIDLGMAGCISWQARIAAMAKGGWQRKNRKIIVMK